MRKGFTLLELIIVVIIIGVLATIGFAQYTKVVEKGRGAEAKVLLGALRTAQAAYKLDKGVFTATLTDLSAEVTSACDATHDFSYACATTGTCTATRCTAAPAKSIGSSAYTITMGQDGAIATNGPY